MAEEEKSAINSWNPFKWAQKPKKVRSKSDRNGKRGHHGHCDHHDSYTVKSQQPPKDPQYQQQDQMQEDSQLWQRTQLYLKDTRLVLKSMDDYLKETMNPNATKKSVSMKNQMVNTRLTLFKMQGVAFRRYGKKKGIDTGDAFGNSMVLISEFEEQRRGYHFRKIKPHLDYMKASVRGQKLKTLPYIADDEAFTAETASHVLSAVTYQANHGQPEQFKSWSKNRKAIEAEHAELRRKSKTMRSQQEPIEVNMDAMCADYHGQREYARSGKEIICLSNQDHQELVHGPPKNLCFRDEDDCDDEYGSDDADVQLYAPPSTLY